MEATRRVIDGARRMERSECDEGSVASEWVKSGDDGMMECGSLAKADDAERGQ